MKLMALVVYTLAGIFALAWILPGCAAPPRKLHTEPVVTPVLTIPSVIAPAIEPITWEPVIEPTAKEVAKPVVKECKDKINGTVATLCYNREKPDWKLACPLGDLLTVELAPGETYEEHGNANAEQWLVKPVPSSRDGLPLTILMIKPTPEAPPNTLTVVTSRNTYVLRLFSGGRQQNRGMRLVRFRDPIAEQQQETAMALAEAKRREKAMEPRYPTLNSATIREYQVDGNTAWTPVKVIGDHAHTFIELPPNIGSQKPILSVFRDDREILIPYRTVPGNGIYGPTLIADETLVRAKLQGEGGEVYITRGGQ